MTPQEPPALGIWEWHATADRATASAGLCRLLDLGGDAGDLASLLEHVHPEDRAALRAALEGVARDGGAFDLHARLGDDRIVRWSGEAGAGRVVAVGRDVTREVLAERAAQRAIHARDEVLAVVSHDLRSPLSIVSMAADAIRDTGGETWAEELGMIKRAVTRMNRLILDILDVTRMEAGRLTFRMKPYDPAALAHEVVELFRPQAERRSVALELSVGQGLPAVQADRDRVVQALSNLVDNALKFTEAGVVRVDVAGDDGGIRFQVADTGSGIDGRQLPHLFDRFWRAEPGGRHRAGNGLGLAIVKGIVDAHGGRVAIDSAVGRGTTVTVTLPPAAAP